MTAIQALGLSGVVSPDAPGYAISGKDGVIQALEAQLALVAQAYTEACVLIPHKFEFSVDTQRKAYIRLIMRYGAMCGMLQFAHRAGQLDSAGYERLRAKAQFYMMPIMVGKTES